ncbi:nucleotide-binding alpha-beta plait domain-containing protein [Tanacetum coccineum]
MEKFKKCVSVMSWFSQVIKATNEFEVDGRIAWVEVEGVPFKLWTNNTFTRIAEKWGKLLDVDDQDETCFHSKRLCVYLKAGNSIREDFKITHRGKMYWIRANETQGWVPEFTDEYEKEVDKTPCLKHPTKQGFTLWNIIVENDTSEEEGKTRMMYSVRLVMLIKLNRKCNGSISAGHFKVSEFLRTGGIHVGSLLEGCDKSWDRGKWRLREKNMLIIGVYAPQRFGIILIHMVLIDLILLFCIRGLVEVNLEFFSCAKQYHMEREVSNDEIKKSVWECGTDKAPGPDGFTFGFFRHFWHLVDRDVCEAVRRVWVWDNWDKWDSMLSSFFERVFHINGSPKPDEFHFGRVVDAGMFHGIDVGGLVNLSHMFYADDAVLKNQLCEKPKFMGIEVDNGCIQILESLRSKFFNGMRVRVKKASWVQWEEGFAPNEIMVGLGGMLKNRFPSAYALGGEKQQKIYSRSKNLAHNSSLTFVSETSERRLGTHSS